MLDTSHASYPTSDYKPSVSPGAPVDSDDYEDDDDHHPKSYEAQAPYPQYAGMISCSCGSLKKILAYFILNMQRWDQNFIFISTF